MAQVWSLASEIFIDVDKIGRQKKTERDTKRVCKLLQSMYPDKHPGAHPRDGVVMLKGVPTINVVASNNREASKLMWNMAAVATFDIDKAAMIERYNSASTQAPSHANIAWSG